MSHINYPSVSCLMPTKNRRAFIPRALAMFLAQDYPGSAELIILEDGADDCADIIEQSQAADSGHIHRLGSRIVHGRFGGTLGAKLNEAARVARGEICINWDDDDWQAPNRISTHVDLMRITGKPAMGFSSLIYYREGDDIGWEYIGEANYASGATHAYRRDYVLQYPRPDITLGEDTFWIREAAKRGDVACVSGTRCLVAADHESNCCPRDFNGENRWMCESSDSFRKVPLSEFSSTIGPFGSH